MAKYIPPRNFNMVTENIYRCITPTDLNYPFLERLNLKSIVYLSSNEMSESLKLFFSDCGVRVYDISKSFGSEINELLVVNALLLVLNTSNLPVMIMSEEGSNKTGIVVACLRKKQKWNLSSIYEEYRRYDGPDSDLDSEQFIELFDPDLISSVSEE